ncbi:MAG: hypothetical protein IKD39_09020 [Oscillospiraceae bacterium]|nr:hypothetical protein [Oscillospiraceae bacterium]
MPEKYFLQNRWKLENNILYYYGLQNKENLFKNTVKLSKKQIEIISSLPRELSEEEVSVLKNLLGKQIVTENELRTIPKSLGEARFCKNCCANDFIIPGIEFDENGLCPMCQTAGDTKNLKSVVPIIKKFPIRKNPVLMLPFFTPAERTLPFCSIILQK